MQDGIINGVGNSRFLKSVPAFLSLYPTYEAFTQALIEGTLPIDLNGINEAGWAQAGTPLNKASLLKDTTAALYGLGTDAVPDEVLKKIGSTPLAWVLIQKYETAGSYTFLVPDGVYEIGVYMIGGGGSGGAIVTINGDSFYANGGASGYGKNAVMKVEPGQEILVVVGAGGRGVYGNSTSGVSGNAGGTTSVNGITVDGGQGGGAARANSPNGSRGGQGSNCGLTNGNLTLNDGIPRYASYPTNQDTYGKQTYTAQTPADSQNKFDPLMVTLSAGGAAFMYGTNAGSGYVESMPDLPDGTSGGDGMVTNAATSGNAATGRGNGGGAIVSSDYPTSGAGSDGAVFIYARRVWK